MKRRHRLKTLFPRSGRRKGRSPRLEPLEPRHLLAAEPIITEFLAANDSGLLDGDGNSSDWIELQNRGDQSIDLIGWHLTDDPADPAKWTFPSLMLDPGVFCLVFASGQTAGDYVDPAGYLHTNFKLDADGEYLALTDPQGTVVCQYGDTQTPFPEQRTDVSYGVVETVKTTELVSLGDDARLWIHPGESIPAGWTDTGFNATGADWTGASLGIGFDRDGAGLASDTIYVDNLLTNGSFEENSGTGTAPAGWSLITNSYGVWNGIAAHDGSWVLHAGHNYGAGGRYQDFATIPGEEYELTFWATGFTNGLDWQQGIVQVGTPGTNSTSLTENNHAEYVDVQFDVPKYVGSTSWVEFTYSFTATTEQTRLSFQNVYLGSGQSAVNIDQVTVSGLMAVGLPVVVSDSGHVAWNDTRLLYQPPYEQADATHTAENGWVVSIPFDWVESNMPGASVTYSFYATAGSTLDLEYLARADGGSLVVELDGVSLARLETNDAPVDVKHRETLAAALTPGLHTVVLSPGGDGPVALAGLNVYAPVGGSAELIVNGSFEDTSVGTVTNMIGIPVGDSTTVPGWTQGTLPTAAATYGHILGIGWLAQEGLHCYHPGGSWSNGTVSQSVATTPGERYQLRFWAAGIYSGWPLQEGRLMVGDLDTTFSVPALTSQNTGVWTELVYDFIAQAETTTVTFANLGGSIYGTSAINIDNVSLRRLDENPIVIQTDTETAMFGQTASALIRSGFNVTDPAEYTGLELKMFYDDGFVAYLNGVEVARRNAPALLDADAVATGNRDGLVERTWETIDLSSYLGLLSSGSNLLAIHVLNAAVDDADLAAAPVLIAHGEPVVTRGYFPIPTPWHANGWQVAGFVGDTHFRSDDPAFHDRGYYDAPFDVTISSNTPGATIVYTTDGSAPSATNGEQVPPADENTPPAAALSIAGTTTLRAVAIKDGYLSTDVDTQTYLFRANVAGQDGAGLPTQWGPTPADYTLDPEVIGPGDLFGGQYAAQLDDSLTALPTLSLVMDVADIFGPAGIYSNPEGRGFEWERAVSIEYFDPNADDDGFQIDAGIRLSGNIVRRSDNPKRAFRVYFRDEYGAGKLDYSLFDGSPVERFDKLEIRPMYNDSWMQETHPVVTADTGQFVRDRLMQDLHREMGYDAVRSRYVQLYINGIYWGLYQVTERPDEDYASEHFGGADEDYDVVKHVKGNGSELVAGTDEAWDEMMALATAGLDDPARYEAIGRLLDLEAFADYMLLNAYTGNYDWPHNNWYAVRNRAEDGPFRFFVWDPELIFLSDVNLDRLSPTPADTPGYLFGTLRANLEFRLLFADRMQRHLFNDGLLQPGPIAARYQALLDQVELPIVGESARWGDVRRAAPYTVADWQAEADRILNDYIPQRHTVFLVQARNLGLYPSIESPCYRVGGLDQHGGVVSPGAAVEIAGDWPGVGSAVVYYTTDGTDPRVTGGGVSPAAAVYTEPLVIDQTAHLTTRALVDGQWSALVEATFLIQPATAENLLISEIHYHPAAPTPEEQAAFNAAFDPQRVLDADDFEFIELLNTSEVTIDLGGVQFTDGITFTFPAGTSLEAGERLVLARDVAALSVRYDTSEIQLAGPYAIGNDNKLSNGGETIRLEDALGVSVEVFAYNDSVNQGWPGGADGLGRSLELVRPTPAANPDATDRNDSASWHASLEEGGTPGRAATPLVLERFVFYNHSAFDGNGTTVDAADDAAIAPDKTALLPDETASRENIVGFVHGINGLVIDVAHAADVLTLLPGDFQFRVGNDDDTDLWTTPAVEPSLIIRPGAGRGGSDRLMLVWPDGTIVDQWLEILLPAEATETKIGMAGDDRFYFGSAVGDVGDGTGRSLVTAADLIAIRNHPHGMANPASIDDRYDINKDRLVDATDLILARNAVGSPLDALSWIAPPS